ncbi:MAG TPA: protein translocase subunit SecD [Xanthobacteraceae bacterium]|nr:protein translocase subunit SecD [Xanthobacteraceae bacterium]
MLHISRWKALAIAMTTLVVCLFAVPNLLSHGTISDWPKWAQRHVVLGLDLQGGSHLLFEVDAAQLRRDKVNQLREEVHKVLREAKIVPTQAALVRGDSVEVRIRPSDLQQALAKLRELSQPLGGLLNASGERTVEINNVGDGLVRLSWTEPAILERIRQAVDQAIQVVTRRVDEFGTVEPVIQRQGVDRILIQVPGLSDPKRLLEIINRTARLDFRMVDMSMTAAQALEGRPPPESEILYGDKAEGGRPYLIEKRVVVSGGDLVDAQVTFDPRTREPVVSMRFNASGAKRWARATSDNVGRPFAIVLDKEVVSAPRINEPITGGQSQISGNFTVQSANDLAILLRAGALPAELTVIEQRVVGAGLGQDAIQKGTTAACFGAILVAVYMLAAYGIFGVFAVIAVAFNVAMIFGVLSLLNATLTLPGIIGIVLTIGIAVDSNVLIYERIREEVRNGRSAISAIDAGFTRALATIVDSNITTFIAAAVLFFIGTGPVRGFAVTFGVGIVTTVFTAFTLTRLMVSYWVGWSRPQQLAVT